MRASGRNWTTCILLPQQTTAAEVVNGPRSSPVVTAIASDCCWAIVCPGTARTSGLTAFAYSWHRCHG